MNIKARLMESDDIRRALVRLSHQIIEKNHGTDGLCLIGIKTRGVPLAERIAANIERYEGVRVPVGALDITHFRDDIVPGSVEPAGSEIDFDIGGKCIVLVDDVIYTCRTARAAMDAVMKLGRPARIQLAALIDRGHSELPIKATYIGKSIPTSHSESVCVRLDETDGVSEVVLLG